MSTSADKLETGRTINSILGQMRYGPIPRHKTDQELLTKFADALEAAIGRELDEAAEHINDYLQEIPVCKPPHDWLLRNGYKDTSYQNDMFEEQK